MNSELLFSNSSFDWLANEIRSSKVRRDIDSGSQHREQKPEPLGVPRLPVDFSPDAALLQARHLRALKFGEYLGSAARKSVQVITAFAAWLNGNNKDAERVNHFEEHRKAA